MVNKDKLAIFNKKSFKNSDDLINNKIYILSKYIIFKKKLLVCLLYIIWYDVNIIIISIKIVLIFKKDIMMHNSLFNIPRQKSLISIFVAILLYKIFFHQIYSDYLSNVDNNFLKTIIDRKNYNVIYSNNGKIFIKNSRKYLSQKKIKKLKFLKFNIFFSYNFTRNILFIYLGFIYFFIISYYKRNHDEQRYYDIYHVINKLFEQYNKIFHLLLYITVNIIIYLFFIFFLNNPLNNIQIFLLKNQEIFYELVNKPDLINSFSITWDKNNPLMRNKKS